jgi:dipeptidyl aminopeptidase/acylaminoacyl peptidase
MFHRRSLLGALALVACADPTGSVADTPRVGYVEPASATLVLARPDGSGTRTVPLPGGYRNVWSPRWSPDGERLAVLGSTDAARRELVVVPVTSGAAFVTRVVAADSRSALGAFDWSPDGRSLAATLWSYDIHVPPGCATSNAIVVTDATPDATPRTVFASQGCGPTLRTYGAISAVRWGRDGRIYFAAPSAAAGRSRILAVSAEGAAQVVRDSIVGVVQAIARSGAWALVLRDPVADTAYQVTAGDFRQLVRVDLATGTSTVLVDRTRLPIPLTFPEDPRIPNDRIRWAQLTADDARVVLALNVEQGNVFGTLLHYHALTPDGRDAGALPGSPVAEPFAVDLRP